jgi:hypothetical protein
MRRWFGVLSLVVVFGLASGCDSTPRPEVTNCVPPAKVRVAGHMMFAGDCRGDLVIPAKKVTLHVGEKIDVYMTEAGSGNGWAPVDPLPRSSRPFVLKRTATRLNGAVGTYIAEHPGHAMLITHGGCTGPGPLDHPVECPVLDVTVVP